MKLRPDIVIYGTPKASLLTSLASFLGRVPKRVFVVHGLRHETLKPPMRWLSWLGDFVAARLATDIVCVSPSVREVGTREGLFRKERAVVFGSGGVEGIDTKRFRPASRSERLDARAALGIEQESVVVSFVGRLAADKGIVTLLEAFDLVQKTFPNLTLLMAGAIDLADPLPKDIQDLVWTHPKIAYLGRVESVEKVYASSDIFTLPSRREGLGVVALEASACGLPIITTSATGARDTVVPFETGFIVPPDDPAQLAKAVSFLVKHPDLRAEMGARGAHYVSRAFSGENIASWWRRVLG